MKRALVLGGGGFIGSYLTESLARGGFWVRCVDLLPAPEASPTANEFMVGDLRDPKVCRLAFEGGFEEVYQLAADRVASSDGMRNSAQIHLNVVDACTRADVGRLFFPSPQGFDWEKGFGQRHGFEVRIGRLPNVFGVGGSWEDERRTTPALLCQRIAMAKPGSEIEIRGGRIPVPSLPVEECVEAIQSLIRSDRLEPMDIPSYLLTVQQLARMILEIAGKPLRIRNIACEFEASEPIVDNGFRGRLGLASNGSLKKRLKSTYRWIQTQLEKNSRNESGIMETCLLQRVRNSVRGRQLIDWADTDFVSFVEDFDAVPLGDLSLMKEGAIYFGSLAQMVHAHEQRRTSHVLITCLDENWGAFSSHVPHRTYPQGDWEERVIKDGCTPEAVRRYLDDPAVKAVVTLQHTAFFHPTILSVPIGIHNPEALLEALSHTDGKKTEELLINNNAWEGGDRERINNRVIANFGGRPRNTYGLPQGEFYRSVIRSRFVLCPSGMGLDTHRLWETLILGSIPIVEYCAGWHRVLDDLPALWVRDFEEVTPELLDRAYKDIHSQCDRFDFRKLTRQWWVARIRGLLTLGSARQVRKPAAMSHEHVDSKHAVVSE